MPLAGWMAISCFSRYIETVGHWIAFSLLCFIGGKMILDAFSEAESEHAFDPRKLTTQLLLAIATSIDALAVGISFACIQVKIWSSVLIIGVTTFLFSVLGVKIGNVFGSKFEKSAGILGGIILILIGLKILLEHLGVMSY
jgi:putative Mn2+ efflux pump MntP